jgi:hypothetical protein
MAVAATILLLTVGAATAMATSNIEGVWSFSGGQIAIQPEGTSGLFEGVVVSPTTFKTCVHPVGEPIWTKITPQTDGSYWGLHQWFKTTGEASECSYNPELGLTAWRVVEEAKGKYLLVCLSYPANETQPHPPQPTIPVGSSGLNATYGCFKSELVAPLPVTTKEGTSTGGSKTGSTETGTGKSGTAAYQESLTFTSSKACYSGRYFKIHLLEPKYDPFKTVVVTLKGKKIKTRHVGNYEVATINLKGLPLGAFKIKIVATTVLGHHLSGARTYHTCAKKPKKSKPKKLT